MEEQRHLISACSPLLTLNRNCNHCSALTTEYKIQKNTQIQIHKIHKYNIHMPKIILSARSPLLTTAITAVHLHLQLKYTTSTLHIVQYTYGSGVRGGLIYRECLLLALVLGTALLCSIQYCSGFGVAMS